MTDFTVKLLSANYSKAAVQTNNDGCYASRRHSSGALRYTRNNQGSLSSSPNTATPHRTHRYEKYFYNRHSEQSQRNNLCPISFKRQRQPDTGPISARNRTTQQLITNFLQERASNHTNTLRSLPLSPPPSTQDEIGQKGHGRVPPLLLVNLESCSYNLFIIIIIPLLKKVKKSVFFGFSSSVFKSFHRRPLVSLYTMPVLVMFS
jgi:hypothetical protein